MMAIGWSVNLLQRGFVAAKRIGDVLDAPNEIPDPEHPKQSPADTTITCDHLTLLLGGEHAEKDDRATQATPANPGSDGRRTPKQSYQICRSPSVLAKWLVWLDQVATEKPPCCVALHDSTSSTRHPALRWCARRGPRCHRCSPAHCIGGSRNQSCLPIACIPISRSLRLIANGQAYRRPRVQLD